MVPVRLFYDFLVEEGVRESNPVRPGPLYALADVADGARALVPRMVKLPWIPSEAAMAATVGGVRRGADP